MLLVGGGGCGKTRIETQVLVPLFKAFFGPQGCLCTAPSNKAARLVGGKTTHAAAKIGTGRLDVSSLKTRADAKHALAQQFVRLGAMIIDEFSQCSAKLYHAISYRSTDGRTAVPTVRPLLACWPLLWNDRRKIFLVFIFFNSKTGVLAARLVSNVIILI